MSLFLQAAIENMDQANCDAATANRLTQKAIAYALIAIAMTLQRQQESSHGEPATYCDACGQVKKPGEDGWVGIGPDNQELCPACVRKYIGDSPPSLLQFIGNAGEPS